MSSKDLLAFLKTQGLKANSHMSALDDTVAQILRARLPKKIQGQKAKKAADEKPKDGGGEAASAGSSANGGGAATAERSDRVRDADARRGRGEKDRPAAESGPERGRPDDRSARPRAAEATPTRRRFFPGAADYDLQAQSRRPGAKKVRRRDGSPIPGAGGLSSGGVAGVAPGKPLEAEIKLPITIKEFSSTVGIRIPDIMKCLMKRGLMLSMNAYLDETYLTDLSKDLNLKVTIKQEETVEDAILELENFKGKPETLVSRAPVVTFLGHVDHGKTSLLDYIRKTKITAREHGGITQHLGAYRVDSGNVHVVFIDTPGHQAFTEMRSRGANITDVAVLVVAADEGVMPQTEEAYSHAKAAGVPIVVALNKIDKPNANHNRCMDQLSKLDLMPVAWGGKTEIMPVSALTGEGINELLETLSLESEILELRADPTRPAIGTVLEAESNPGRGILATVLVQDGTLRIGDYVLCGSAHGRVRNMWLNGTTPVLEAPPSSPVQISGLSVIPEAGDRFYVFADAARARGIAEERSSHRREQDRARSQKISLENVWDKLDESTQEKELRVIVKADVKGTLEALANALGEAGTDEVRVRILHAGVGAVGQDDILLAHASEAIVLGFNTPIDDRARASAEEKQVEIRMYKVIYEAIKEIRQALEDKLAPILKEVEQGVVEIRKIYSASKIGKIAGCYVKKGTITRDSKIRLRRDGKVIYTGTLASLKRFKDDVREAKEGFECGLTLQGFDDVAEGDVLEAYTIVKERRSL